MTNTFAYNREMRQRYTQRKAAHLCVGCGAPAVHIASDRWLARCQACREDQRQRNQQHYAHRTRPAQIRAREAPGVPLLACCGQWWPIQTLPMVCGQCGRAWLRE